MLLPSYPQVYFERVDSTTAGAAFNFSQCGVKDISRPLSDLEKYPAIKIRVSKGFSFSNIETEYSFEEQRGRFFQVITVHSLTDQGFQTWEPIGPD